MVETLRLNARKRGIRVKVSDHGHTVKVQAW